MKNLIQFIVLVIIAITFTSCGHYISTKMELIIIKKEFSNISDFKYNYTINNPWEKWHIQYYSNEEYNIGDTLKLVK